MTEEIKITDVKAYRDNQRKVKTVQLPSGAKFKVKRISILDYVENGMDEIPNDFLKFVDTLQDESFQKSTVEDQTKIIEKNAKTFERYIEITLSAGVVEPNITMKYDKEKKDTHLVFSELSLADQEYLMNVITGKIDGEIPKK